MQGVSAKVAFGEFIEAGTNCMKIVIDEQLLSTIEEPSVNDYINLDLKVPEVSKIITAADLEFNYGI